MIEIRFSKGEIDLQGTPSELRGVRQAILDFLTNDPPMVHLAASVNVDSTPYQCHLESLIIRKGYGPVRITVAGKSLEAEGESEMLKTFAEWFNFTDNGPDRYHCHFEYYEGNSCIAPESVPLVISVHRSDAA